MNDIDDDYFDLGTHERAISSDSPQAHLWFNRGLIWSYAFNYEEAARCFRRAIDHDADCAIAYWGLGYSVGPHYNKQWDKFDDIERAQVLNDAYHASQEAMRRIDSASTVEAGLIGALARRHPANKAPDDYGVWNDEYAEAMRAVYKAFPHDYDVCTLFVDAMMNRTPWTLWDLDTGEPSPGADTLEAIEVVETAMAEIEKAKGDEHPGLLHVYIHLQEMSPTPELALRASDSLRNLAPEASHLRHMPTHIYAQCGNYHDVVQANHEAIVCDRKFLAREGYMNFQSLSRAHNLHFKLYGAMFLGQYAAANDAANELFETLPEDLLRVESPPMADWLEGYVAMKIHAPIRFGKWQQILEQPLPQDRQLYCTTTALLHYARGLSYAVLQDIAAAEVERERFDAAVRKVPISRTVFNNTCQDILAIAAKMLDGEIKYRKGEYDAAFNDLRAAVKLADDLPYDEPWGWMQPPRHALGALLLEQDEVAEAERVYRADLGLDDTLIRACKHPDNVWALHGFHECLRRLGKDDEAAMIEPRLRLAQARADVPIKASCLCRVNTVAV